jgi:hypothetical protein
VHHESLALEDAISKLMRAHCVIDLPFPTQTGSTQRVIQALAFKKKVLTTNTSASLESFFDQNFIRVISTNDRDFLLPANDKSSNQPPEISHLRIDNWLKRLLAPSV